MYGSLNTQYHGQVRFFISFMCLGHLNPLVHNKHVKGGVGCLQNFMVN